MGPLVHWVEDNEGNATSHGVIPEWGAKWLLLQGEAHEWKEKLNSSGSCKGGVLFCHSERSCHPCVLAWHLSTLKAEAGGSQVFRSAQDIY